ncbi:MAG: DNA mismatch repair endonuclease MutL [Oscillospiraceae bacterium]|nr:DNA mismatch repair endonuclease MutL [Oscillospiraceae bacterium]
MPKIQQLSPHLADLIAAGEVVERPASAAKELVENAIDAGAKNITVELQEGGMTFLRITDDGCGMLPEDARTAFLRHATSKLRTAADLEAIHTLGFRGEALAAISAVSRVDLLTKTADSPLGYSLHLEAGKITEEGEAGCPNGTTIIVRDLFYNTPARMKFMKRDSVEAAALLSVVQRLALAHPELSFRVIRDGEVQLQTSGDGRLLSAIHAAYGNQVAKGMLPVKGSWDKYTVEGYASAPTATRGKRDLQIFFVNGRHVRSKTMCAALEEAYRNRIMVGRFPSCVLHLRLPEHLVDVNVHPAKIEVKFLNERDVFDCIHYGVKGALEQDQGQVELRFSAPAKAQSKVAEPKTDFFRTMTAEQFRAYAGAIKDAPRPQLTRTTVENTDLLKPKPVAPLQKASEPVKKAAQPPATSELLGQLPPFEEEQDRPAPFKAQAEPPAERSSIQQELVLPKAEAPWRIIGEAMDTYIIIEQNQQLLFLDKHAAHERILFEKLRAQQDALASQLLLQPILCTPEREDHALLLENLDILSDFGFSLSDYGDGTLAIRQIPADISESEAQSLLLLLAEQLRRGKKLEPGTLRDEMLHTIACKAAVKGGMHSDRLELQRLVEQVLSREDLKYCPHGRPICAFMTRSQLERQFKRS